MVVETVEEAKAALRSQAHAIRAAVPQADRADAAAAVAACFFKDDAPASGTVVAAYWRIRDELDCQPILIQLMDSDRVVILPVVIGADAPLDLRVWEQGEALYEAGFGTLAPSEQAPRAEPDLVIMPLLGFDKHGTRLGYGGGYYDRTLAQMSKKPKLIGLAFAVQELDEIPREAHDIPLDAVITEHGIRHFGAGA